MSTWTLIALSLSLSLSLTHVLAKVSEFLVQVCNDSMELAIFLCDESTPYSLQKILGKLLMSSVSTNNS